MKKSKLIIIIALAVVLVAGAIVAIVLLGGKGNVPETSTVIIWTDSSSPSEEIVDPEVSSPAVVYPEKPQTEPTVDSTLPVTIGSLVSSDECYTLTDLGEGKTKISYNSVNALPAFAYVYVPVENYQSKYGYLKIKADCVGVQKIAVVAVYYEQYDLDRPGVTIYNNALLEGENLIICDLNEASVLDECYNVALGEKVTQKKIVGFMLIIDSNPKQVIDDYAGEMTINSVAVVDETDPDLSALNAPPTISNWTSSTAVDPYDDIYIDQSHISETTGSKDAIIDYSFSSAYPYVEAQIYNFKSDYTTVKMALKGENVKNVTIAIKYSLSTITGGPGYNYISTYGMEVSSDYETYEFDFSTVEELSSDFMTAVPGSYVKNLKPIALYFFIDTADIPNSTPGGTGTLYVKDVEFVKVVDDGIPKVTSTWSVISGSGITKSNVETGGIGTLVYDKWQGWNAVTLNVSSYNSEYSVLVVKVKFYGAKNLGIALGYGSGNTVIQNSDGQTTANINLTHTEEAGSDEKGDYVFHTYRIDFTNALTTLTNEPLTIQSINQILLYIDAVKDIGGTYQEVPAGGSMNNPRTMQFVGITFEKPQVSE